MDDQTIGSELRAARLQARISQTALADTLGVSRETIRRWENGDVHAEWATLTRWATAVGRTVEVSFPDGADLAPTQREALDVARRVLPALDDVQAATLARMLRSFEPS